MSDTQRLAALERAVASLTELAQLQGDRINRLQFDLAETRAELRQIAAEAAGAKYLASAALDV